MKKSTGEVLEYSGLIDKNGYKTYRSLEKTKLIRRHIYEEWNEHLRINRLSKEGKKHVERIFAGSKQNHGYRYTMYKGVKSL